MDGKVCSGHYTRGTRSAGYTIFHYYSGMKSQGGCITIFLLHSGNVESLSGNIIKRRLLKLIFFKKAN